MKQSLQFHHGILLLLLLVLLSSYSASAARFLLPIQGEKAVSVTDSLQMSAVLEETDQQDSLMDLMGEEDHCENGDEECLKRRMMAEAHLDYIYTQHHPKP